MSTARDEMLARIRTIDRGPTPPSARTYRRRGTLGSDERIARLCDRLADYRADVHRLPVAAVPSRIADICEAHRVNRLGIPSALPAAWRPAQVELVEDRGLDARQLDKLDGVLTGCTVAIAETGTIALTAGGAEGRRALTLVPDLHVCVVGAAQIVELVPEAIAILGELVRRERRPITLVSGPSATSDIELTRVEGVHGPRTLVVVVAEDYG